RQGHTTVTLDDGSEGMVPEEWLRRFAGIAGAGEASGDHVRFKGAQAALLDAALARLPSVSLDERFVRARDELASFGGLAPLDPASSFQGKLRDYQRDALGWMSFLRRFGFGGCLADDMGLGKTIMVLALLEGRRQIREAGTDGDTKGGGKRNGSKHNGDAHADRPTEPSLVVAPRSL